MNIRNIEHTCKDANINQYINQCKACEMEFKSTVNAKNVFPRLTALRDLALKIATEHGFHDASVPEDIALMHSELSEALEDYRAGKKVNELTYEHKRTLNEPNLPPKPCGIPSEMADVIIRVLHFCGKHEIDIEKAVLEKMQYNESRPYKHGKKI
jgi:NTP pyrophosphatase (non-canonical NTP hydrolase)